MKTTFTLLLYSAITGLLLSIFSFIEGFSSFIFSIAAFFVGLKYFRTYDSLKLRIIYVVTSIILVIVFIAIFVMFSFGNNVA